MLRLVRPADAMMARALRGGGSWRESAPCPTCAVVAGIGVLLSVAGSSVFTTGAT